VKPATTDGSSPRDAAGPAQGHDAIRESKASTWLDLETLIWTPGAAFLVSTLEMRLKCPRFGSGRVALLFELPANPQVMRA